MPGKMLAAGCALSLGLLAGTAVHATSLPPQFGAGTVSPDAAPFGMGYGDWAAAWWQYVFAIPADDNPLLDATGGKCAVGQTSGPVFFLVGSFVGPVTRTCTVPRGRALFFPIINFECSTVEDGLAEAGLRQCAGGGGDAFDPRSLKVLLDHRPIQQLDQYRAQSPVFGFTLPPDNIINKPAGTSESVTDGYYVMLRPLSPGNHVVHFEGACATGSVCAGFSQNVTYNLTVQ